MIFRVGTGFDAHRLAPGRPLLLGGITVPHEKGLVGHSDGDCVLHAVCDALLGALAEGDMGRHFPSSDPRWKGAPSRLFLAEVHRMTRERAFEIENLDVTVIAQVPTLLPHLAAMREALAETLQLPLAAVSVKAKSTDGMGALGRGEGIAAQAAVLLRGPAPRHATATPAALE